jgi:3-methyladenine DNA glycosylase AlkC
MPTADELLSAEEALTLACDMQRVAPDRDWESISRTAAAFPDLGLRDRVTLVRDALLGALPANYLESDRLIRAALSDSAFAGWRIWPLSEAIAVLATASSEPTDLQNGLELTAALTSRLTCEFALRIFLNANLDATLDAALDWAGSTDEHVRRLASEGTRPLLPWAARVPAIRQNPSAALPILDALRRDNSESVRRSVANHLNDISRLDPDLAVATVAGWLKDPDEHTAKLARHALRTLIKQGHRGALATMGFGSSEAITVEGPRLAAPQVAIGESLSFEATLSNDSGTPVKVAVDYVIHFRKANGTQAPKVFKLTTRTLAAAEKLALTKSHSLRLITTRRYHEGAHALEIQVNGRRHGRVPFELVQPAAEPARPSVRADQTFQPSG